MTAGAWYRHVHGRHVRPIKSIGQKYSRCSCLIEGKRREREREREEEELRPRVSATTCILLCTWCSGSRCRCTTLLMTRGLRSSSSGARLATLMSVNCYRFTTLARKNIEMKRRPRDKALRVDKRRIKRLSCYREVVTLWCYFYAPILLDSGLKLTFRFMYVRIAMFWKDSK